MSTNAKRTIFLAVTAAVALSSLGEGVAAAVGPSTTTSAASPFAHRDLQSNNVLTVCPDATQCTRGRRCYKTGREAEESGLDEYACGDCEDIDDNNDRCEFAEEVFCVVSDDADTSNWFCVNEGRCINDRVGSIDRARCQCPSRYEGPNCQLRKSTSSITEEPDSNNDPNDIRSETGSGSRALSTGAIIGIAVGGFVALVGLLLLLGRRKGRGDEDHNDSVISSVEHSQQFQHSDDHHEYA